MHHDSVFVPRRPAAAGSVALACAVMGLGVSVGACTTGRAAPAAPAVAVADPAVAAIEQVRVAFTAAIVARDEAAMLALMAPGTVPFRARPVDSGKVFESNGAAFAHDIGGATTAWAEEFSDVVITPRDGLAVLDASYRFLEDGKVSNHGREVWTLIETPDGWRITSVSWSIIVD